jgi:CubicO group peptidase (beta-lactamase class C family)
VASILGLAFTMIVGVRASEPPGADCPASGDEDVIRILRLIREKHRVPAIAAARLTSRGIERIGVVGVRKSGTDIPATTNDHWHLGSETKAMTATLVGRFVERGVLRWDSTVAEVFPEFVEDFHVDSREVTIRQLLNHRAGLPANLDWAKFAQRGSVSEQRQRAVRWALAAKPRHRPGETCEYSNLGYVVVGAILEKKAGRSWEESMTNEVFAPLGMTNVGFGGTGTPGRIDQPWGHTASEKAVAGNGPDVDNPPLLGPAGRVHATLTDWARFITDQLRGARGEPALLRSATYRELQTPPTNGEYALGWMVLERDWGGGKVLHHAGCNTMNYANVWVAPQRDLAILVCVNQGDEVAFRATDEVAAALIRLPAVSSGDAMRQPGRSERSGGDRASPNWSGERIDRADLLSSDLLADL